MSAASGDPVERVAQSVAEAAGASASADPSAPAEEGAATEALEEAVGLALQVLKGVTLILLLAFLASGFFTVESSEVAFVRRFGVLDASNPLEAGLHWRWQVIEEDVRVDKKPQSIVADAHDLSRTVKDLDGHGHDAPKRKSGAGIDPTQDGYLLTADANVIHVTLAARIVPVAPYLASKFRFVDPTHEGDEEPEKNVALRLLLERAALHTAAYRKVDGLLGGGKAAFLEGVQRTLQASFDEVGAGFDVQGVDLERDLRPPPQVEAAFGRVTQASQQVDSLRSAARSAATRIENSAIVRAAQIESDAQARAAEIAADAAATRKDFDAVIEAYERDPEATKQRLLAEVLADSLGEVGETFLVGEGELRVKLERDTRAKRSAILLDAQKRLGVDASGRAVNEGR